MNLESFCRDYLVNDCPLVARIPWVPIDPNFNCRTWRAKLQSGDSEKSRVIQLTEFFRQIEINLLCDLMAWPRPATYDTIMVATDLLRSYVGNDAKVIANPHLRAGQSVAFDSRKIRFRIIGEAWIFGDLAFVEGCLEIDD